MPPDGAGMIVGMTVVRINAITVPADSGDELARRFAARAGAVDDQDGFEGFELLKPTDGRHHLAGGDPVAGRGGIPGVGAAPRVRARAPVSRRAGGRRGVLLRWESAASSGPYEVAGGSSR